MLLELAGYSETPSITFRCAANMAQPEFFSLANGTRSVPTTLLLSFLAVVFAWSATCHADQPNIVLIMADDMGLGDISYLSLIHI